MANDLSSNQHSQHHQKLPPIITNQRDRVFLGELSKFIDDELNQVDQDNPEQRYLIHRAAFDKIVEHVTAYKPILTAIKAEYEECIDTIIRGKREAFYLNGKLKAMASEPSTVRNYKKRSDELEDRIAVVTKNNEELQSELDHLCQARKEREEYQNNSKTVHKKEVKIDRRPLPGVPIEKSVDLNYLSKELANVEKQLKDLKNAQLTKFQPREAKNRLKNQLDAKAELLESLTKEEDAAKTRNNRLRVGLEAAQAYLKVQPMHKTIGEVITVTWKRYDQGLPVEIDQAGLQPAPTLPGETTTASTFEDDDPGKEKEADLIMDYIDKFNELFDDEKYEAAAIHAANSPRGILRTMDTLIKFKSADTPPGERQPLLAFCDAVMSSVMAIGVLPSEAISVECVKSALENNRLDLLSHWISQERLRMNEGLGDMIKEACKCKKVCICSCQALAQKVYTAMASHVKVVDCMLQQGRVQQALEYARQNTEFQAEDYGHLLKQCPSPQLAQALLESEKQTGERLVPLGMAVKILLNTDLYHVGFQILEDNILGPDGTDRIHQEMLSDDSTTEEEWLEIIRVCQNHGHKEASIELLAAITVVGAMKAARNIVKGHVDGTDG